MAQKSSCVYNFLKMPTTDEIKNPSNPPPDEPPDDDFDDYDGDDGEPIDWVEVASFSQPTFAHIAKLKLESEGIRCYLDNENFVATDWLMANAVGGIKLRVPAADAERARAIIDGPSESIDNEIVEDETEEEPRHYARPGERRCPKCGSGEVSTDSSLFAVACGWLLLGALIGFPIFYIFGIVGPVMLFAVYVIWAATMITTRKWKCDSCDFEWIPGKAEEEVDKRRGFPIEPKSKSPAESQKPND